MNNENKLQYIYNSINKQKINNDIIYKFIIDNNLNYSENNNGFFFNLSKLDSVYIDELFTIVNNNHYENISIDKNNIKNINNNINDNNIYHDNDNDINNTIVYEKLIINNNIDNYLLNLSKIKH